MALAIGGIRLVPVSVTMAAVLAASGLAVAATSASGARAPESQAVHASLSYLCRFPTGPRRVRVAVSASLPTAARSGRPIQPTSVKLTLALPPAAVAELAGLHTAAVHAITRLTVAATDTAATGTAAVGGTIPGSSTPDGSTTDGSTTGSATAASTVWRGATRRPAALPAHAALTLRAPGWVPALLPAGRGKVVLTAGGLAVTFTPGKALSPGSSATPVAVGPNHATGPGQATSPKLVTGPRRATSPNLATGPNRTAKPGPPPHTLTPTAIRAACILAGGQQAILATVPVTGAATARHLRHTAAAAPKCPKLPASGLKLNPRFPLPPFPPGSNVGSSPSQACAFTTGYADARKLKGSVLIPPALTNVDLTVRTVTNFTGPNYLEFDNVAQLDFHGQHEFPPATGTFLSFGFVPTTATIILKEHGNVNIIAVGPANPAIKCKPTKFRSCDNITTIFSRLSVEIEPGSVKINGVPLDVGDHCGTPAFDAVLEGSSATKPAYNVQQGGPIFGFVDIPNFSGCGVGENLDPIFNAAISGQMNFNLLTQGAPCFEIGAFGCSPNTGRPTPPKPLRKVSG